MPRPDTSTTVRRYSAFQWLNHPELGTESSTLGLLFMPGWVRSTSIGHARGSRRRLSPRYSHAIESGARRTGFGAVGSALTTVLSVEISALRHARHYVAKPLRSRGRRRSILKFRQRSRTTRYVLFVRIVGEKAVFAEVCIVRGRNMKTGPFRRSPVLSEAGSSRPVRSGAGCKKGGP